MGRKSKIRAADKEKNFYERGSITLSWPMQLIQDTKAAAEALSKAWGRPVTASEITEKILTPRITGSKLYAEMELWHRMEAERYRLLRDNQEMVQAQVLNKRDEGKAIKTVEEVLALQHAREVDQE